MTFLDRRHLGADQAGAGRSHFESWGNRLISARRARRAAVAIGTAGAAAHHRPRGDKLKNAVWPAAREACRDRSAVGSPADPRPRGCRSRAAKRGILLRKAHTGGKLLPG